MGFTIAIALMAGIREELDLCDVPKPLKGAGITLIVAGIMAMAFMGFAGVDKGLEKGINLLPEVRDADEMADRRNVLLAAALLLLLALAMAFVLGWANRAFHVEVDPKVRAIDGAVLPGANCGGCGYVGCSEYAEAVAAGEAD